MLSRTLTVGKSLGRKNFTSTAPSNAKLFRGLFKKTSAGVGGGFLGPRITLFRQEALPEDLRLPVPANPGNRIAAGMLDLVTSLFGGGIVAASVFFSGVGDLDLASAAGQGTALVLWAFRDSFSCEGTRSIGKRVFKIEITNADGSLASPTACALRNWYYLAIPLMSVHPFVALTIDAMIFADVATLFVTEDGRKTGDYMFGTRVVDERPNREIRVMDQHEQMEMNALKAELESYAPGILDAREQKGPKLWYEQQREAPLPQVSYTLPSHLSKPGPFLSPDPAAASNDSVHGVQMPSGLFDSVLSNSNVGAEHENKENMRPFQASSGELLFDRNPNQGPKKKSSA